MSDRVRKLMACAAGVLLIAASLLVVAYAMTQASVKALINNQCVPEPGFLVVPAGKTARNFKLSNLSGGNNCHDGRIINEKSFKIGDFTYLNRDGKITQGPGTLATLALGPGTYQVTVSGGRSAFVGLSYELWP